MKYPCYKQVYFKLKYDLTELKSVVVSNNVEEINNYAFAGCTKLTDINFSECLTTIGDSVFLDCTSLEYVDLSKSSKLTQLGAVAFRGCTNLESVNFSSLKELGALQDTTFYGCSNLKYVDLSSCISLKVIGLGVFLNCDSLETLIFPESVETFELGTIISGCENLIVQYAGTSTQFKNINCYDSITSTHSVYCIADGVTIEKA